MTTRFKLLLVEDDLDLRDILATTLENHNYAVFTAASGQEALVRLRAEPQQIDLVLSDVHMSPINGVELARQIGHEFPSLPVFLMSGRPDAPEIPIDCGGAVHLFKKPFRVSEAAKAMRATLLRISPEDLTYLLRSS